MDIWVINNILAGDVGSGIVLTLDDAHDMLVNIDTSNGSAVLRLTTPLDKERLAGPPSLAIPVNIR